jgi:hypothetical protein
VTRLSAVVTVVDGGQQLARLLRALVAQDRQIDEIIVPWDASIADVGRLKGEFPGVNFLSLGTLATDRPIRSHAGQHALYDKRRSAGLAMATGDLVAITEDRVIPDPGWSGAYVRLHQELPHAVIGGAIDEDRGSTLNRAIYLCDFGRYQPPFEAGEREYISDVNICYKRQALDLTRSVWGTRYHETSVHWALRRAGQLLWLSPEPRVVVDRGPLKLGVALGERLAWGRLFAVTRAAETTLPRRLTWAAATPVLPGLLYSRILRGRLDRRRGIQALISATPALFLLLSLWAVGEALGYLSGQD